MRVFVTEAFAIFPVAIFLVFTLGLGLFYELFCLMPRGQTIAHWVCGTPYRDVDTGRPLSFCQMFLLGLARLGIYGVLVSIAAATLIPCPLVWWLAELCVASNDPHNINRTMMDKMMGCAVVYRPIGPNHDKFT